MMSRLLKVAATGLLLALLAIQLVPYGRNHTNPPVTAEPAWDGPQTRQMADRACFDCHSNQTRWLWYSNIAPVSWLVQRDVDEGREELNFSEWDRPQEAEDLAESVQEGEMPPRVYLPLHPEAQLSAAERAQLAQGLAAIAGGMAEGEGEQAEDD